MNISSCGTTSVGRVREHNEDNFCIEEGHNIFVVADGMGGHAAGEVASKIAVETVVDFLRNMDEDATWPFDSKPDLSFEGNKLATAIRMGNRRVAKAVEENSAYMGMGTTLISLFIKGKTAYIGHVGDSRAYLIREGNLDCLTMDHSWINSQLQAGAITAEMARKHPLRNVITRALGSDEDVAVDIIEKPLRKGDMYLLCSDGLNSMLSDEDILDIIMKNQNDVRAASSQLIDSANNKGGEDNTTVILVKINEL